MLNERRRKPLKFVLLDIAEPQVSQILCPIILDSMLPSNLRIITNLQLPLFRPGDTIAFACDNGLPLFGSETLTCGTSGQFEGALPTCGVPGGNKKLLGYLGQKSIIFRSNML